MGASEVYRCWQWPLVSSPADIWPLISNTDRFNEDSGVPSIERLNNDGYLRSLRLSRLGVTVEWEEEPFEWVRPERFGVMRRYRTGPLAEMRVLAELISSPARMLRYQVWAKPRNLVGRALVAVQLAESGMRFGKTVRQYDEMAAAAKLGPSLPERVSPLVAGGRERIERGCRELLSAGCDAEATGRLCAFVERAADRYVNRIRPYSMAREWGLARRPVLELFLRAAHAGLLELQWDLLCPSCRGAKQSAASLAECDSRLHCDSCQIDFSADFARSVELTFRPSPEIRELHVEEYCAGGPQNTPHIVMQQILDPGQSRTVRIPLETGAYRYRQWGKPGGGVRLNVIEGGASRATLDGASAVPAVDVSPSLELRNDSQTTVVMVLERTAWSDLAATAAEVTASPLFRELFGEQSLRPGEQQAIEQLTVMFTDFPGTTDRCIELGDSAALRLLLRHAGVLTEVVSRCGGTMVKLMGDRGMAVFRQPEEALRAALEAQTALSRGTDPVLLRVGIHCGAMVAVTLNERLDYFGAAVNLAAKACELSSGKDIVVSQAIGEDARAVAVMAQAGRRLEKLSGGIAGFAAG